MITMLMTRGNDEGVYLKLPSLLQMKSKGVCELDNIRRQRPALANQEDPRR
jgi:hypothetical protein